LTLGEGVFHGKAPGCIVLNARTGEQVAIYAPYEPPQEIELAESKSWPLEIDDAHSGRLTLAQTDIGLIIKLRTIDPKVTNLDQWELYFDFRAPDRRFGLFDHGVFQVRITPPANVNVPAMCENGIGREHPGLCLNGSKTKDGSEVSVTLTWDDVKRLIGRQPMSFGFAAVLNSHDGDANERIKRSYLFCDLAASGINNGWANIVVAGPPKAKQRPVTIAGTFADLPKVRSTRLWPMAIDSQVSDQLRRHPLTGELGPRIFRSGTGTCGGFDFSATSIVKRSGAAKVLGIYDFEDDSGLHTFVGVSAGCNATTTTALGMMIVSESKARCVCTFPYRTTVALAPDQRRLQEDWAIFYERDVDTQVRQARINLGAFGDRRDDDGNLWLAFPRPLDPSHALGYPKLPGTKIEAYLPGVWPIGRSANMQVPLDIECYEGGGPYRFNADRTRVHDTDRSWTYTSGYRGIRRATLRLNFYKPLATQSVSRAPQIDANLSKGEWPAKPQLTLPGTRTEIYLAHDVDHLYVAAHRPGKVDRRGKTQWTSTTKGDDAEIWNDDSWELFLGDTTSTRVAHFGVSITGARYDATGHRNATQPEDADWNATWQSAASANDEVGIIELAIPWKTIEAVGLNRDGLAINFLVNRDAKVGEAITYLGAKGRAGCSNLTPLGIETVPIVAPRRFRVRLHFAQPPNQPAVDPFAVKVQGKTLAHIDINNQNEHEPTATIQEFRQVEASDSLTLDFEPLASGNRPINSPVLSAIEIKRESSNATE
jgi:hypothetical protein